MSDSPSAAHAGDAAGHVGSDGLTRALGAFAFASVVVFSTVCLAVQFLRPDYHWLGTPLSFYLLGPYGRIVAAAFWLLALGLAAIGIGAYRALAPTARSAAPLLLFVVAAIALSVTAIESTDLPDAPPTLHGFIHVVAAVTTFLCVTVAMLLQSWRWRGNPRWHIRWRGAFALAVCAFALLWIDGLARILPRGFGEKLLIVLILVWLWRAAWWLARGERLIPARAIVTRT